MRDSTTTLRDLLGLGHQPATLKDSALLLIDCQNTYREGVMRLTGVEEALKEARKLLDRARDLSIPVIHVRHDAGEGSPFDINADIGAFADIVAPQAGEPIITKNYPNSFVQTDLDEQLKALGVTHVVLAGFMTHMCINSTAHGGFNLGYTPTVVASATASRPLETETGVTLSARQVHEAALASTRDLYATVVEGVDDLP